MIIPSSLYKLKSYFQSSSNYTFNDKSKVFVGDTMTVLRSFYPMPGIDTVNEWVICVESLLKDVYTINSCEQVLIEAFVY